MRAIRLAGSLRRACGWNSKAAKAEFDRATKIKFARREGEILFATNDKILSAKLGAGLVEILNLKISICALSPPRVFCGAVRTAAAGGYALAEG